MKFQNKPAQCRHGGFVLRSVDDDAQVAQVGVSRQKRVHGLPARLAKLGKDDFHRLQAPQVAGCRLMARNAGF